MRQPTPKDVATVLFEIATILETGDAKSHLVTAYRRAARHLIAGTATLTVTGEMDAPGLGPQLRAKLGEVIRAAERSTDQFTEPAECFHVPRIARNTMVDKHVT